MFVILAASLVLLGFSLTLTMLNRRHLEMHGAQVPLELVAYVQSEHLQRMRSYGLAKLRLEVMRTAMTSLLLLLFLFGGLLGAYDRWIASRIASFTGSGLVFFLLLYWAEALLAVPFSLFRNFRIESRYGFNSMTLRLWFSDFIKSLLISSFLLSVAVWGTLTLVLWSSEWWWLWVWLFFLLLSLFVMYVSPYVIEPLFNKLEPLRVQELEGEIQALLQQAGLEVKRVLQVDASRRSSHSNAYFTGFGKVKRIVLFDTLLQQMKSEEILAVLAHEAGHWKKKHVLRRIVVVEAFALLAFFAAARVLQWDGLPGLVGLEQASFSARVLVTAYLGSMLLFVLTPIFSFLSRRDEWEADRFALELTGRPEVLASALGNLARENLANLHPHPTYAWFHFSHPPVVERIRNLLVKH